MSYRLVISERIYVICIKYGKVHWNVLRIVFEFTFKSMIFIILESIGLGEFVQDISRTLYLTIVGVRLGAPMERWNVSRGPRMIMRNVKCEPWATCDI